jgi:hypothetical protein
MFSVWLVAVVLTGIALFWVWYEQDPRMWRRLDGWFPLRGWWVRRGLLISCGTFLLAALSLPLLIRRVYFLMHGI